MRIILNNAKKYKQEAVIPTLVAPATAPVAPAFPVADDRLAAFRHTVAERLRAANGQTQAEIVVQISVEQTALAKALAGPKFIDTAAALYAQEMTLLNNNIPLATAKREITSIFKNRVADCQRNVAALGQPDFMMSVTTQAAQPAAAAEPYKLSARKIEEIVSRFVQAEHPDGAEPAVHVGGYIRGQQATHQALAILFRPSGQLHAPLIDALTAAAPQITGAQVQGLAGGWLKARHDSAHATSDALKEDGVIAIEAMRRAEAIQNQKLGIVEQAQAVITKAQASSAAAIAAPKLDLAATTPSPITTAPRVAMGKVQTTDLAMDSI